MSVKIFLLFKLLGGKVRLFRHQFEGLFLDTWECSQGAIIFSIIIIAEDCYRFKIIDQRLL